jgi:hypothetical protein
MEGYTGDKTKNTTHSVRQQQVEPVQANTRQVIRHAAGFVTHQLRHGGWGQVGPRYEQDRQFTGFRCCNGKRQHHTIRRVKQVHQLAVNVRGGVLHVKRCAERDGLGAGGYCTNGTPPGAGSVATVTHDKLRVCNLYCSHVCKDVRPTDRLHRLDHKRSRQATVQIPARDSTGAHVPAVLQSRYHSTLLGRRNSSRNTGRQRQSRSYST